MRRASGQTDETQGVLGLGREPWENRGLFADNYLEHHLPDLPDWQRLEGIDDAFRAVLEIYRAASSRLPRLNESQTEHDFIQPILNILWGEEAPGDCYQVQVCIPNLDAPRQPDYAFFRSSTDREAAHACLGTIEFWGDASCLGDAKKWSASLDKERGAGESPSSQIANYLYRSRVRWGILTNGRLWRLYEREKSSAGGVFFQVDLEDILRRSNAEAFRAFYAFFRRQAFLPDADGKTFVEQVFQGSVDYATEVGDRLKESVYDALRLLMNGFFEHPANGLDRTNPDDVRLVHDNSLIVLYRLLFLLYAEDNGLLPLENPVYFDHSLKRLHQEINGSLRRGRAYLTAERRFWGELTNMFELIDDGLRHEGQVIIPDYNGGLFSAEKHPHIAHTPQQGVTRWEIGDHRLADVIDMLAYQRDRWDQPGSQDIDYNSLDVQHLGGIYEGLLELKPQVATEPLVEMSEGGKSVFRSATQVPNPRPIRGQPPRKTATDEIYLVTDRGERKATGSYYTPDYIVAYIVENTVGVLADETAKKVAELRSEVDKEIAKLERSRRQWEKKPDGYNDEEVTRQIAGLNQSIEMQKQRLLEPYLSLKILDPAMGSGHFLVGAADFLSMAMATDPNILPLDEVGEEDPQAYYKRLVVERCLYGVDLNPLAVELAKLSLWLHTVSKDKALSFLDHHLRRGNSLIGATLNDMSKEPPRLDGKGRPVHPVGKYVPILEVLTGKHLEFFLDTFRKIVETPTGDAEMERTKDKWYRAMDAERDRFRAVGNCWLAPYFGIPVTPIQYDRVVRAVNGTASEWNELAAEGWFEAIQGFGRREAFFHWELEFPEVFFKADGLKVERARGFDAVIGNPPYIQARNMDAQRRGFYYRRYRSAVEKVDVFAFFCESLSLLMMPQGYAGLVLSQSWLGQTSFMVMRRILFSGLRPQSIALNPSDAFDANVETLNLIVAGENAHSGVKGLHLQMLNREGSTASVRHIANPRVTLAPEYVISFAADQSRLALMLKIESQSIPLGKLARVNYGLKTGDDTVFVFREPRGSNPKPVVFGENVAAYVYDWGGLWVNYVPGEMLARRPTARPGTPERFEAVPKLVFKRISQGRLCAAIDRNGMYCTISTIVAGGFTVSLQSVLFTLACVNSTLMLWYLTRKRPKGFLSTDLRTEEVNLLPVRRIDAISGGPGSPSLCAEATSLCAAAVENGDTERVVSFISFLLGRTPERADVVRDLLAHLAEQMVDMNEEMRAEVKGFLEWLECEIGAKLEDLGNKSKVKAYHEHDLGTLLEILRKNGKKLTVNPADRSFQENIRREFENSVAKLTPLKERIAATDRLIDQIVYKLYGLTEEEIAIVEGEAGPAATD